MTALTDQKATFAAIRHYLAGRALGATRDVALLQEVLKCLYVRKHMLLNGGPPKGKAASTIERAFQNYFEKVRHFFPDETAINLDAAALKFVNEQLTTIDILNPSADPIGDVYEAFVGSSIRGADGQFFTPHNAGRWLVQAVAPASGEHIIDPACGAGGFLFWAAQRIDGEACLVGIEKDEFLADLARSRIAITGKTASVYCANSLSWETHDASFPGAEALIGQFDVVLTNPPFGKNIVAVSRSTQKQFELGHKWRRGAAGVLRQTNELATKAPPQVLFLERIISLLKNGGRAGVVLPESLLSSRSHAHAVQYLRDHAAVKAVVGMPESLFKTSGKGGTHTKTALVVFEKGKKQTHVFMGEAKWCGNDSRGKTIARDDLPTLLTDFRSPRTTALELGYHVKTKELRQEILAPRYYAPAVRLATQHLEKTHELVSIQELMDEGALSVSTGDEVGKLAYGSGDIPFIRTSDIAGWELKIDPKHCVSDEIYERLRARQDVRRGDILMVRDGTYLIGSCAFVTAYDERIVYQSHILKFRCNKPKHLSPALLLAVLSSEPVQKQIKAKTFTQDIIDSLGSRYAELVLPLPRDNGLRTEVEDLVEKVIADRVEARELSRKAKAIVAPSAASKSQSPQGRNSGRSTARNKCAPAGESCPLG